MAKYECRGLWFVRSWAVAWRFRPRRVSEVLAIAPASCWVQDSDLKVSRVHITPELRYTRWGTESLTEYLNVLRPAQNQGDFLIGFTF